MKIISELFNSQSFPDIKNYYAMLFAYVKCLSIMLKEKEIIHDHWNYWELHTNSEALWS